MRIECVDIAVFDPRDFLLLGRRTPLSPWCLPGGKLEPFELTIECAYRELREETGVRPGEFPVHLGTFDLPEGDRGNEIYTHLYRFNVSWEEAAMLCPSDELPELAWCDPCYLPTIAPQHVGLVRSLFSGVCA